MENIYKIKIRSNHDPRGLYPSERRYSASIVLGLSVVFIVLTLTSALMGTLIFNKINNSTNLNENTTSNILWTEVSETTTEGGQNYTVDDNFNETETEGIQRLEKKVEKDIIGTNLENLNFMTKNNTNYFKIPNYISAGTFIMSLGTAFAAITGILAWNRWYIDHYILLFFLCSLFSTLTAAISFLLISITLYNLTFYENLDLINEGYRINVISYSLALNTIICSVLSFIWSVLSTKVAYKGMLNTYPDDITISKGGNIQVSTIRKGSKNCNIIPPDIINHFPNTKLAKYFPKKENKNLPKSESNREYNERVNKFLTDNMNTKENK